MIHFFCLIIIVYDRKIKEGAGESIYGLMVARSLHLPSSFIDRANYILHDILGENKQIVDTTTSKYNKDVYVDHCKLCGKNEELHTHHIQPQNIADERGMIDNMHKNVKGNLIVLCRDCHTQLHSENKEFETLSANNGKIVIYKQ